MKRGKLLHRERNGFTIVIGPWACRLLFDRASRFANGRWFSSGWHRWR